LVIEHAKSANQAIQVLRLTMNAFHIWVLNLDFPQITPQTIRNRDQSQISSAHCMNHRTEWHVPAVCCLWVAWGMEQSLSFHFETERGHKRSSSQSDGSEDVGSFSTSQTACSCYRVWNKSFVLSRDLLERSLRQTNCLKKPLHEMKKKSQQLQHSRSGMNFHQILWNKHSLLILERPSLFAVD
jgi:hypothetical protein